MMDSPWSIKVNDDKPNLLAITREVSSSIGRCELTHVQRGPIDVALAQQQHARYCDCLQALGASVVRLPALDEQPDATFVEDTAVVVDEGAILCSMGTSSRRTEPVLMRPCLENYRHVSAVHVDAPIEGGDVLQIGRVFYVGLSTRTSQAGIQAFREAVEPWGYSVMAIPVRGSLHLKTALCALDSRRCLINSAWIDTSSLSQFELIEVPPEEPFAANIIAFDQRVLVAEHHVQTASLLRAREFEVLTVDVSELAKAEAGLTCLSLIFRV